MDEKLRASLKTLQQTDMGQFILTVLTTPDNLKAFIQCSLNELGEEEERATVKANELIEAVDEKLNRELFENQVFDAVADLLSQGKEVSPRRISKGTEPKPGRDGRIVELVKPYKGVAVREENDFIDTRFLRLFDNVEKETIVARIYPPKAGMDGVDIFGQSISAAIGAEPKVLIDKTLDRLPNNDNQNFEILVSKEAGFLQVSSGSYSIQNELALKADIDYKTGDLEFIGSIRISGDVKKNFSVRARGDIEIAGDVIGATIISEHGSITVKGDLAGLENEASSGVEHVTSAMVDELIGGKKPFVSAAHKFSGRTVHGADLDVGYSVDISKELRDCKLRCGGTVNLPSGHLVGGHTRTACGLEAAIIGTEGEARTNIELCSDVESTAEYRELSLSISKHESAAELLNLHLGQYATPSIEAEAKLDASHREKLVKLRSKLDEVRRGLEILFEKQKVILNSAKFNPSFRVNFKKLAFPGLKVTASEVEFTLKEPTKGPKTIEFDREAAEFSVSEIAQLECAFEPSNMEENK